MRAETEIREAFIKIEEHLKELNWRWEQVRKYTKGKDQDDALRRIGREMDHEEIRLKMLRWVLQES